MSILHVSPKKVADSIGRVERRNSEIECASEVITCVANIHSEPIECCSMSMMMILKIACLNA